MDNELSRLKLYEMIKGISSSKESLDTLTEVILKASSELDDLIKSQSENTEPHEDKT